MRRMIQTNLLLICAACSLAACGGGGGGGGSGFNSTPPPPTGVLRPPHIGLVSASPFAVLAMGDTYSTNASGQPTPLSAPAPQDVQFSYDSATNRYQISIPGFQAGRLAGTAYSGTHGEVATHSTSQVTAGSSNTLQPVFVSLPVPGNDFSPYTYTSFGSWNGQTGVAPNGDILHNEGAFTYGIPTAPGDVPTTGTASYNAEIQATMYPETGAPWVNWVSGSASLMFDFAGGTLSGSMHPEIFSGFYDIFVDFGVYDFTQTVYSTGSTSFSGKFIVPGMPGADSFFDGSFTGPNAAELMARFEAPFSVDGQQGVISGGWIGRKCC